MTGHRRTRWAAPMKGTQRARRSAEAHPQQGDDLEQLGIAYARLRSAYARARKQNQEGRAAQHLTPAVTALTTAVERVNQLTTRR